MNPMLLLGWQRYAVYGALILLVVGMAELDGYRRGEKKLFEYKADQAKAAVVIVTKRGAVTERVVTKYVKVAGKTQTVTQTVKQEVVRYAEANPGYCLDVAWGRLHDAAAANAVPDPSVDAHGAERAPTAAGALETVTASYAACHRTADKLDALQVWVREQEAVR